MQNSQDLKGQFKSILCLMMTSKSQTKFDIKVGQFKRNVSDLMGIFFLYVIVGHQIIFFSTAILASFNQRHEIACCFNIFMIVMYHT